MYFRWLGSLYLRVLRYQNGLKGRVSVVLDLVIGVEYE